MKQLIDKSALVAEIERLEKINQEYKKTWKWKFKWFYRTIIGRLEVLEGLKNFINTLEVKDVDLEEKACNAYCKVCGHYAHTTPNHICRQTCDYYKNFKKYIKGE